MEALNNMIGTYATTGADASLIIERIHKSNSVRLNKNNDEKMQNFTDVLLRRFVAIGDSIYENGNGGEVSRYNQLDALTRTLYELAQESPETCAAVWSRRLGFLQSAHLKRLRDVEFEQEDNFTAWPSTGTILLLRALGHIFPVTDKRHAIVTPALLFLCEVIGFTPILSINDIVAGLSCCALALEFTKEAKRVVPEAVAFLSGVIRLFGSNPNSGPLSTLNAVTFVQMNSLLKQLQMPEVEPTIILERAKIEQQSSTAFAILHFTLHLAEACTVNLAGTLEATKPEAYACFAESILTLRLQSLPLSLQDKVRSLIRSFEFSTARKPLQRRLQEKFQVKSLAPRMEPLSTKKVASTADRMRREYKRERKTVARELRLDASIVESERRTAAAQKGDAARAKRHKAHAWLQQEQATINNQVRQGGGLLRGGGIGAARAKAATAKLGMKKGGKL
jgi:nucleolar protein 14